MPEYIFVDTSVVRSQQFNFANARFRTLGTLAGHGQVVILTTDVTTREIHANLDKLVDERLSELNRALAGNLLQRASSFSLHAVQHPLKEDSARGELHREVDEYFSQSGVVTLPASSISSTRILDQYFSGAPPFGTGKKKSEFPDAFAAAALIDFAAAKDAVVRVVSDDGDWEAVCAGTKELVFERSLSSVVEGLLKDEENARVIKAHAILAQHTTAIARAVADALVNEWVYLEDVNGEVEGIESHSPTVLQSQVISVEEGGATIELLVRMDTEFTISYDDPTSWIYDSEDKVAHYMNRIEATVERTMDLDAEVSLSFDQEESDAVEITDVRLNGGRRIGIVAEEFDEHH
jgi:hypothetical protein